jgi:TDG/mug DNA glycosylase family protein
MHVGYTAPGKKGRRRKAAATLRGQVDLNQQPKPHVSLPLKIPANCHTLFMGLGPGLESARKGRYFPGKSNYFWKLLKHSKLCPSATDSEHDDEILQFGFGLADVIERPTEGSVLATKFEFMNSKERVRKIVQTHKPKIVAFVGLKAYRTYLRDESASLEYGEQRHLIEGARVWVLPSTSGASVAVTSYSEKIEWFEKLAEAVKAL